MMDKGLTCESGNMRTEHDMHQPSQGWTGSWDPNSPLTGGALNDYLKDQCCQQPTYHTFKCVPSATGQSLVKYSGCKDGEGCTDCDHVEHNSPEYLLCQDNGDGSGSHKHHCGELGDYADMPNDIA